MSPANRKADQSFCEFQTGIGVAPHAYLDTQQLISHTKVSLVDTISSLQDYEGRVISVLEVHELLTKIHDILDNAVSKEVGNTTHILAHFFTSASRQHPELWASQLPFPHSLKVPSSEVCLYGHIN